jgi:hypothetical protein
MSISTLGGLWPTTSSLVECIISIPCSFSHLRAFTLISYQVSLHLLPSILRQYTI